MKALLLITLLLFATSCNRDEQTKKTDYNWAKKNPAILPAHKFSMNAPSVLIKGAKIMTASGVVYEKANLLMEKGLIKKISETDIKISSKTKVIDGEGSVLTPGIIDVHSHMGVYPNPGLKAHSDGNEASRPVTSEVWAEHGFWPQDPSLWRALSGGVTTVQILPGSANLIGGRSFTAKLIPKISARAMRFDGAPQGLKMACGENPKRVYKKKGIMTRMGNVAGYRKAFQKAIEYTRSQKSAKKGKLPKRDFVSETLAKVIQGKILLHFHCYRADDISAILDVAKEFGFKIRTIHHGLEAYKLAPRLAKENVAVATWADWWGFKAEAYDGIPYNAALLHKAGAKAIIHSDSSVDIRFLNVEAAKAMVAGRQLGLDISEDEALAWITKNPAWALGIEEKVGTLEEGKMADIVMWDGHPFSVYSKTKKVFINGRLSFDREQKHRIRSDFEIGHNDTFFYDGRDFTKTQTFSSFEERLDINNKDLSGEFALKNVNIFSNGKFIPQQTVFIKNGVIQSISNKVPSSVKTLDAQGAFLTPGLIGSNTTLGLIEIDAESSAEDARNRTSQPSPDNRAVDGLNLRNTRIPIDRKEGLTTSITRPQGNLISGQAVAFDLSQEDSSIRDSVAIFGSLQSRSENNSPSRGISWSKLKQIFEDALYYSKNKSNYNKGLSRELSMSSRNLAAMEPLIKGKTPWVVEINRADDIERLLNFKDNMKSKGALLKIVLSGASESWLIADKLAQQKIPVIIQPTLQAPRSFSQLRARFDLAAYLHSKNVPLIINSDAENGSTRLRQEAGIAVKYGLPPAAALTAITETPGKVFNLNRGTLSPGAVANMVLWSEDPLEPTSEALQVWIAGKTQELTTRQKLLGEKYLKASNQ